MIQREVLEKLVSEYISDKPFFLVDITVSKEGEIEITIDSEKGSVSIDDCIAISRHIETRLDRNIEDFSLTVGSSGLTAPFKVLKQYRKAEGEKIEITRKAGERIKAVLLKVYDDKIDISYKLLVKQDGKKKKVEEEIKETIPFSEIKSAKAIIDFK